MKKLLAKCAEDNDRWIRLLNELIQSYLINVTQMKKLDILKSPPDEGKKDEEGKKEEEKEEKKEKAADSKPDVGTVETKQIDTTEPSKLKDAESDP